MPAMVSPRLVPAVLLLVSCCLPATRADTFFYLVRCDPRCFTREASRFCFLCLYQGAGS